jgi:hypothetical protein
MRFAKECQEECRRLIGGRAGDEALSGRLAVRGSRAAIRGCGAPLSAFQGRRLSRELIRFNIARDRRKYRARDRRISSVIQSFKVLCDRSQLRIGRDDLEVAARNSFAPQFAHFDDNVATHKAAELGNKATVAADD